VPTVRSVLGMWRLPYGLVAAAAGSYVLAIALSWHGPNQWPYAWLDGVRRPTFTPAIKHVLLDSPLLWLLVLVVVVGVLVASSRLVGTRDPRLNVLRAVPILAVISLAFTSVYTVYTFGLAAVTGVPRASIWAQGLADPTASRCGAAAATEVLDPYAATPLTEARGLPAPPAATGFVPDGGYYAGNRPQGVAAERVWGSLIARDGAPAERTEGEVTTPWYTLPPVAAGTVNVIAAGSLADGVQLRAEYGRRAGDAVEAAGSEVLTDAAQDPSWRTLTLDPATGADVVRLVGVDASGAIHGWTAFSAPVVARPVALADFLPRDAPVALGWPLAFGWPCQRQPGIVNGITEPAAFGVLWGASGTLSGFSDGAFQPPRGGAFAQLSRSQSVLQLATVPPVDPNVQVVVFSSPLGRDRYTLLEDRRTESGTAVDAPPRHVG
jgi:hypothetical protein